MDIGAYASIPQDLRIILVPILVVATIVDGNTPPQWVNSEPSIFAPENMEVATVIATLKGRDVDGDSLTFDVMGADGVVLVLRVSNDSATVVLNTVLDREAVDTYNFKFTLSDGINDPISRYSTLYVLDRNDNAPHFVKEFYRASVTEDTAKGREVLRVSAQDPDLGHQGLVTYTQDPEGSWSDFTVDWVSGIIRVKQDLDMGRTNKYDLTVRAMDGDGLFGTTQVEIQVTEESSNSSNNALHCYHCNGTTDCRMEQLSYSTTSRCKPNQLCYIEARQKSVKENEYSYSRGCREVELCGERDTEQCTTTTEDRTCSKCCSDRTCNRDRLTEHRRRYVLEEAMNLGGDTQNLFNEIRTERQTGTAESIIRCYHCNDSEDCALEQLSYSRTTMCGEGTYCFVDAVLQPLASLVIKYNYTRGCRSAESCTKLDKELCSTDANPKQCTLCCSDAKCNGLKMLDHRYREAKELMSKTSGKDGLFRNDQVILMSFVFFIFVIA